MPENTTRPPSMRAFPSATSRRAMRVELVLGLEHARRQRRFVIADQHRHRRLRDDRSVVHIGCNEMHRAAMHAHAGLERPCVGIEPLEKGRSAGWMLIILPRHFSTKARVSSRI